MADLETPPRKTWLTGKRFERQEDVIGSETLGGNQEANGQIFEEIFRQEESDLKTEPLTQKRFEKNFASLGFEVLGGSLYRKVQLFLRPAFTQPVEEEPVVTRAFSSGFSSGFS